MMGRQPDLTRISLSISNLAQFSLILFYFSKMKLGKTENCNFMSIFPIN